MTFSMNWKDRLCVVTFSGTVDDREVSQCDQKFDGHHKFDQLRHAIWDFSNVENFGLTEDLIIEMAAIDTGAALTNARIKLAFVVNTKKQKAFANLYKAKTMQLSWDVEVFDQLSEAEAWFS